MKESMGFIGVQCAPKLRGARNVNVKGQSCIRLAVVSGAVSGSELAVVNMDAYSKGLGSVVEEETYEILVEGDVNGTIEGSVPSELRGTLFRNMPGRMDVHGEPIGNYWDGDGMVVAFSFGDGKVFVRNRFVRTVAYLKEDKQRKAIYRGMFGSLLPGGNLKNFATKVKHSASRYAVYHHGRLLALHDWGLPYSLDPASLLTKGGTTIRMEIPDNGKMVPSARVDPTTGLLVLASKQFSPIGMEVLFKEFDSDFRVKRKVSEGLRAFGLLDDFALTENYYVVSQPPFQFDMTGYLFGVKPRYQDALSRRNSPGEIVLIPRNKNVKKQKMRLGSERSIVGQIANAFETTDGSVIIDAICTDELFLGEGLTSGSYPAPRSSLVRYTVSPSGGKVTEEILSRRHVCNPSISTSLTGQEHRFIYGICSPSEELTAPKALIKVDTKDKTESIWAPESAQEFSSEPVFVPRSDHPTAEDDGFLVSIVYNGNDDKSYIAVLDAKNVAAGPLCKIHLRQSYPHGLRSSWTSDIFTLNDAKKYNSYEIFQEKGWNKVESGFSLLGLQGIEDEF